MTTACELRKKSENSTAGPLRAKARECGWVCMCLHRHCSPGRGQRSGRLAIGAPVDRNEWLLGLGPTQRSPVAGIPPPWQCNKCAMARTCKDHLWPSQTGEHDCRTVVQAAWFKYRLRSQYCSHPTVAAAWVCTIGPGWRLK